MQLNSQAQKVIEYYNDSSESLIIRHLQHNLKSLVGINIHSPIYLL